MLHNYEIVAFGARQHKTIAAADQMIGCFNPEQYTIYLESESIVEQANDPHLYFLDRKEGQGRKFAMSSCLISKFNQIDVTGKQVLANVAIHFSASDRDACCSAATSSLPSCLFNVRH